MVMRQAALDPRARRIVLAAAATATALVMLLGYRTSTPGSVATTVVAAGTAVAGPAAAGDAAPSGGTTAGESVAGDAPTSTPTPTTTTATGGAVATRYGPVQVQITVTDGAITAADAVQIPNGNSRDVQINSRAVPLLNQETLDAQSAGIDTVSGATYTSDGYAASLQSAIDAAGL